MYNPQVDIPTSAETSEGLVTWMPNGYVSTDSHGHLRFPPAPREPGLYRYIFASETGMPMAGYVGETGRKDGLHGRFAHYRSRGITPYDPPGTTSRLAARMQRGIVAGQLISVEILDGWASRGDERVRLDFSPKAFRLQLERELVAQLRSTGIDVINH